MSDRDSANGCGGCLGAILLLAALGWVVQHLAVVLATVGVVVAAGLLLWGLAAWVDARTTLAAERHRCQVCSGWSHSVLLTDLDEEAVAALCRDHAPRYANIWLLERDLGLWES
jgi:hypothetical protein